MKIGILTYHSVYNFGANLQALSTFNYLKKVGHDPIIINFRSQKLEEAFDISVPKIQADAHKNFVAKYFRLTDICQNSMEVAKVIESNKIEAVIIGSDAVVQHHPFISRIKIYPSRRRIIRIRIDPAQYETNFPNPFWGEFLNYTYKEIPTVMMSVSSQNTSYYFISGRKKQQINETIKKLKYISVRDKWTQNFFSQISNGKTCPITPDPVFAFNNNCSYLPSKNEIITKFHLPEKYVLLCFGSSKTVSQKWLLDFEKLATGKGYSCVALCMPEGIRFQNSLSYKIDVPLYPIEWYCLIKYSSGYVGEKMHPIIVSLHNCIPFFSFDHYGILRGFFFLKKSSSKIYDILSSSGFADYRVPILKKFYKKPSPYNVLDKLINFNIRECQVVASLKMKEYESMMTEIIDTINK